VSDIRRREFITLVGGAATAWPLAAGAQQPDRMRRIAVLMGIANELEGQKRVTAFRQGLQAAGWAEGLNVRIDYHWVGGDADRARAYAVEVIGIKPDVILANGTTVVAALQHEARSIPVAVTASRRASLTARTVQRDHCSARGSRHAKRSR
jgi:putative tryptophan/tyrosine transport system substrate-binding protein